MALTWGRDRTVYLFDRSGVPLQTMSSGGPLHLTPKQVEGVLALTGHFAPDASAASSFGRVAHMRYDDFGILGVRGERAVVATVVRGAPDERLLPELRRFLRRWERRLRRFETD